MSGGWSCRWLWRPDLWISWYTRVMYYMCMYAVLQRYPQANSLLCVLLFDSGANGLWLGCADIGGHNPDLVILDPDTGWVVSFAAHFYYASGLVTVTGYNRYKCARSTVWFIRVMPCLAYPFLLHQCARMWMVTLFTVLKKNASTCRSTIMSYKVSSDSTHMYAFHHWNSHGIQYTWRRWEYHTTLTLTLTLTLTYI